MDPTLDQVSTALKECNTVNPTSYCDISETDVGGPVVAAQPATPSIFRRNSTKEGQPSKWGAASPSKSGDSQESSATLKPYIQLISDLFTRVKLFMMSTVECL